MSNTVKSLNSITVDATGQTFLIPATAKVREIWLENEGDTNALLVNIPAVDGDDVTFQTLGPEKAMPYAALGGYITQFTIKAAANTTIVSMGIKSAGA